MEYQKFIKFSIKLFGNIQFPTFWHNHWKCSIFSSNVSHTCLFIEKYPALVCCCYCWLRLLSVQLTVYPIWLYLCIHSFCLYFLWASWPFGYKIYNFFLFGRHLFWGQSNLSFIFFLKRPLVNVACNFFHFHFFCNFLVWGFLWKSLRFSFKKLRNLFLSNCYLALLCLCVVSISINSRCNSFLFFQRTPLYVCITCFVVVCYNRIQNFFLIFCCRWFIYLQVKLLFLCYIFFNFFTILRSLCSCHYQRFI